jgi:hypothetical protein
MEPLPGFREVVVRTPAWPAIQPGAIWTEVSDFNTPFAKSEEAGDIRKRPSVIKQVGSQYAVS